MGDVTFDGAAGRKYAAHFRFDMTADGHESAVLGLDGLMDACILEPVRVTVWNNQMSRYYITDERGPKFAQAWALICDENLVYHGPL